MRLVRTLLFLLVLFINATLSISVLGHPSLEILSPTDDMILTNRTVNMVGWADGSNESWTKQTADEFNNGTLEHMTVGDTGTMALDDGPFEDFDDGSWNYDNWSRNDSGGISAVEEDGVLHQSGTSTEDVNWSGVSIVCSNESRGCSVTAELVSFSGSGSGYYSAIQLAASETWHLSFGLFVDKDRWGNKTYLGWRYVYGTYVDMYWEDEVGPGSHVLRMNYYKGVTYFYDNGTSLGWNNDHSISGNPKVRFMTSTKGLGSTVDARWDNVSSGYVPNGTYLSSVFDTGLSQVTFLLLDAFLWNYEGITTDYWLRSSDNADMVDATDWIRAGPEETAAPCLVNRYLQYKIEFTSKYWKTSPQIEIIRCWYYVPLERVEVSVDAGANWANTTGLREWNSSVDVPEGTSAIWARATDVLGSVNITNVTVDVDTTRPTGSVVINDGDTVTMSQNVRIALDAYDKYGIAEMIVSERSDFTDQEWHVYMTSSGWLLSPGEGVKTVYVKFRDANGWESDVVNDTIIYDTLRPRGSISINNGSRYTNSSQVGLSLSASDTMGISEMMLSNSPNFTGLIWRPFAQRVDWTLVDGDGDRTVYVIYKDGSGLTSNTVQDTIIVDTRPPVVRIFINGDAAFTNVSLVSITLNASDDHEVSMMQAAIGHPPDGTALEPFAAIFNLTLSTGDGEKVVFVLVQDAAGNVGEIAYASIVLDTIAPVFTISIGDGSMYTNIETVTLYLVVSDDGPISELLVSNDPDITTFQSMAFTSELGWSLFPGDGRKFVYASVRDAANNRGPVVSASVILDTVAPTFRLGLDSSSTSLRTVLFHVEAEDLSGCVFIELGEDADLLGAMMLPFSETVSWNLSSGDGTKVVYGRVYDMAGNAATIGSCSVFLDTTPPTAALDSLPPVIEVRSFMVTWSAIDEGSGVGTYDVQRRDGDGQWSDWIMMTSTTQSTFDGVDGHTYAFRVRAVDNLGNLGEFSDTRIVQVILPRPIVALILPTNGSTVRGILTITGTSLHPYQDHLVDLVLVRIDDGEWISAQGTTSWEYALDTTQLEEGRHKVAVKAFDGESYSNVITREFIVRNAHDGDALGHVTIYLIALSIGMVIVISIGIVRHRHHNAKKKDKK